MIETPMGPRYTQWAAEGWRGWRDAAADVDPAPALVVAARGGGRTSRHARTVRVEPAAGQAYYVKVYPEPGGWRARRAFRMGQALARAGFAAPHVLLAARRDGEGLLVTRDVGGRELMTTLATAARGDKRALLHALGREIAGLHAAGFVHGDLVPPNLRLDGGGRLVFLDNDRTRRSRLLVALVGRRNLVQLGRFVVPGVTLSDRARVLAAYAARRGLTAPTRRRLGWWVVRKTTARRCAIDHIPSAAAARAGYRLLMRSGGPFDRAREATS